MLRETSGRTAQDLAAELAGLHGIDWASVWAGPPQGGSPEFRKWCERYAWEPQNVERNLVVHSRSGGRWTFESNGNWTPVFRLTHWAWRLVAEDASENPALHDAAASAWPEFLAAAESVLGPAQWSGAWDAEDFPEPPERAFWADRDFRLETRDPHRMAFWPPRGEHPGQAFFVLDQAVSFRSWGTQEPGSSVIVLKVYAPEGSKRRR
ncbi:hypothetical protein ACIGD1_06390 [Streptomyces sp. NPDC085612]|uniref:hypothetical protein n=1 Tax=Streptomyces sp. NPDC085612 TaxID=3365732 RepID=UPI0037D77196